MTIPDYDAWKLSAPDDDRNEIGTDEGQPCNRYPEPDEDAPRGYRPRPCGGTMVIHPVENCSCHLTAPCGACVNNPIVCDTCGESA